MSDSNNNRLYKYNLRRGQSCLVIRAGDFRYLTGTTVRLIEPTLAQFKGTGERKVMWHVDPTPMTIEGKELVFEEQDLMPLDDPRLALEIRKERRVFMEATDIRNNKKVDLDQVFERVQRNMTDWKNSRGV